MSDEDCVPFLQWALPRLGMRWAALLEGARRRLQATGKAQETHDAEWLRLEVLCRIPISRFWRDRNVFDRLAHDVLPALAAGAVDRGDARVRVWSAGCASGEEAYSLLRLAWSLKAETVFPSTTVDIVATDIDDTMLARASAGLYQRSSLRNMPPDLIERAFRPGNDLCEIRDQFRRDVDFLQQDVRSQMPEDPFDLILCRNLVFTYFDGTTQADLLAGMCLRLRPGGCLVNRRTRDPAGVVPRPRAFEQACADLQAVHSWTAPTTPSLTILGSGSSN